VPFGSPGAPSAPFAPFPATKSQRTSSAVTPSASTAIDEPPSFVAAFAWMLKSAISAPPAFFLIVSATSSASPTSTLFFVAPTYVHPFAQSSPP
jgi:hypothetical protein